MRLARDYIPRIRPGNSGNTKWALHEHGRLFRVRLPLADPGAPHYNCQQRNSTGLLAHCDQSARQVQLSSRRNHIIFPLPRVAGKSEE